MSVGTAAKRRFLAPDLARGIALVGIAMANMVTNWDPTDHADHAAGLGGYNGDGTLFEKALVFFETMFVHVRGLPMFATLLGVGMGMIFASLHKRGYPTKAARRVLARRYAFLMLFGIVHLTLFFTNDIMTAYGIAALLLCLAIGWGDTALYILAAAVFVLASVGRVGGITSAFSDPGTAAAALGVAGATGAGSVARITDLGARMVNGLHNAPFMLFIPCIEVPSFFPLVVIGFVWGRGGVFGDVGGNRRMLTAWAVLAWVVIVGFGVAWGCTEIGALPEVWSPGFSAANQVIGMLTGPGILATIALVCQRTQLLLDAGHPLPSPLRPLVALGKRSMSGYLSQTVLFILTTQPATWWVTRDATIAGKLGWAVLVWLATLAGAWALEKADKPGPFEWAHRRLAYGKNGLPERYLGA